MVDIGKHSGGCHPVSANPLRVAATITINTFA
jgi:hypothetical protein